MDEHRAGTQTWAVWAQIRLHIRSGKAGPLEKVSTWLYCTM